MLAAYYPAEQLIAKNLNIKLQEKQGQTLLHFAKNQTNHQLRVSVYPPSCNAILFFPFESREICEKRRIC